MAGGDITGFTWATPSCPEYGKGNGCTTQDLQTLKANVASHGPASICVNAESWHDYTGGVMTEKTCRRMNYPSMDHCVQLVGYSPTYWIVRNSWGRDFGIDGYIHLDVGENTCGVADYAAYFNIGRKQGNLSRTTAGAPATMLARPSI